MNNSKSTQIGNYRIEEFYWAGDYVVYINNNKFSGSYDDAIKTAIMADDAFVGVKCQTN